MPPAVEPMVGEVSNTHLALTPLSVQDDQTVAHDRPSTPPGGPRRTGHGRCDPIDPGKFFARKNRMVRGLLDSADYLGSVQPRRQPGGSEGLDTRHPGLEEGEHVRAAAACVHNPGGHRPVPIPTELGARQNRPG